MIKNYEKLNIYVLNWNQADLTIDCVDSLITQTASINIEIFIIDNGSTDGSVEIFKEIFPQIKILANVKNLGFQGGMNVGIRHAMENSADYVLLLNNDTIADPDMIGNLLLNKPDAAALVSPAIFYHDDRNVLCSLGGKYSPVFLEIIGQNKKNITLPDDVKQYEFLPSHAWLIKTEIFSTVGLLDESFFPIYYDDLDFCLRLKRNNYSIYLIPQSRIYHRESMSVGGRNSPKERYLMARNSGYYFRKHMSVWQAPLIFNYRLGSGLLWTAKLLLQKNTEAVKGYWKGFYEGWFKKKP